jgi:hypothetical protein
MRGASTARVTNDTGYFGADGVRLASAAQETGDCIGARAHPANEITLVGVT